MRRNPSEAVFYTNADRSTVESSMISKCYSCTFPDSSSRLHQSVERVLDLLADTTRQLTDVQRSQRDLVAAVEHNTAENEELRQRVEELEAQLAQETEAKEYLAVELNKAEGKRSPINP